MKKNYYAKVLALTVAASMVSVPAFAEEENVSGQGSVLEEEPEENKTVEVQALVDSLPIADNFVNMNQEEQEAIANIIVNGTKLVDNHCLTGNTVSGVTYSDGVLTLDNASVEKSFDVSTPTEKDPTQVSSMSIYVEGDIKIVLKGENSIKSSKRGIYVRGNLEIEGDGNITFESVSRPITTEGNLLLNGEGKYVASGISEVFYSFKDITFNKGEYILNAENGSWATALSTKQGNLNITGGKIKVVAPFDESATYAYSIYINGSVNISGGNLYTNSKQDGIYCKGAVTITNGTVDAVTGIRAQGSSENDNIIISGGNVAVGGKGIETIKALYLTGGTYVLNSPRISTYKTAYIGKDTNISLGEDVNEIELYAGTPVGNNTQIRYKIYRSDNTKTNVGYFGTTKDKVESFVGTVDKNTYVDSIIALTEGGIIPSNTTFTAGNFATPVREGYIFDGWYEKGADGDFAGNAVAMPEAGKTYYAKWRLVKPAICVDGTATKVYDGKDVTLSVPAVDNATYAWKKGETNVGTSNTLKLKDVADSGSYTCTITVGEESETSDAVVVSITKAPITLTSDRQSMKGAGTVTLTVNGIAENEKNSIAVTCDDTSVNVNDSNGTYTAYLPNATKTYTFTATGTNSNYEWKDNSCTVSVSRKKSSSSSSDTSAPTYGVSTSKTENGKISVTPAKAEAGEKVTIKATPDSGYQLDKVTVKDKDNSNVKLTKVNDNEYTFTMPKGKVSVDATFVQKDAADDNSVAEKSKVIKLQIGSRIVNVDNEAVIYDAAPVIRNDRTLVPIRIVTETLGGKVDWNGVTKEVTLNIDGKEIKMTIGKTLEKYGVAPVIIDGRTFVPVRFVADELGATVAWDDATKTVTITKIEK